MKKLDVEGRSLEEQRESAMALAEYVHSVTGIPLEYEATYHCIAFLPSRMHSGGSLTKYWAYGNEEYENTRFGITTTLNVCMDCTITETGIAHSRRYG